MRVSTHTDARTRTRAHSPRIVRKLKSIRHCGRKPFGKHRPFSVSLGLSGSSRRPRGNAPGKAPCTCTPPQTRDRALPTSGLTSGATAVGLGRDRQFPVTCPVARLMSHGASSSSVTHLKDQRGLCPGWVMSGVQTGRGKGF